MIKKIGFLLVLLMVLLQGFYGVFAYVDPMAFTHVRGTLLASSGDVDWVRIYASRTMFVALIIGFLLYRQHYTLLAWAAFFGLVMPITDGWLAYQAGASFDIIFKHVATAAYLIITIIVLRKIK